MCPAYKPKKIEGALKSASAFTMLLCTALVLPQGLEAANGTFNRNGAAAAYNWGDASNWTSSIIADGAGSYAFLSNYNVTAALTINVNSNRTIGHLMLGDRDNATRFAVNLGATDSNVLTFDNLGGTSYLIQTSSSSANTISTELKINNDLRIRNQVALSDNTQRLIITGPISAGTAGDKVITIGGLPSIALNTAPYSSNAYTSAVQINGVISDGSGKVSLVVNNPTGGPTVLNGTNTFSGGVTLKDGALELNTIHALGTGIFTIQGGVITSTAGSRLTFNAGGKNMILAGDFTAQNSAVLDLGSTGTIQLQKDINVSVLSSQFGLLGKIDDGGAGYSITKTGNNILYFSNTGNSFSGGLNLLGGRTIIGTIASLGTSNLSLNYGASAGLYNVNVNQQFVDRIIRDSVGYVGTYGQANPVTANVSLANHAGMVFGASQGTMTYNGTLTAYGDTYKLASYSGATTIFNRALTGENHKVQIGAIGNATGTVIFNADNTYQGETLIQGTTVFVLQGEKGNIARESSIRMTGASTFQYSTAEATGTISDHLGQLILAGGDATLTQNRVVNVDSELSFDGLTRQAGGTLNLTLAGTNASYQNNRLVLLGIDASEPFVNQGVFWNNTSYAAVDASGHLRNLQYGVDANTKVLSAAANAASAAGTHVNLTGNVTSTANLTLETLRFDGAHTFNVGAGNVLTLTSGGILKTGGTNSYLQGGAITSGDQELVLRTTVSDEVLFITSDILSSTTQGITKSGAGTVTLSGNNQYLGNTTVNTGTLRVLGTQALGTGDIILNGGSFDFRERTKTGDYANVTLENIYLGNNVYVNANSSLVVSSIDGVARYQNKTIQYGNLSIGGSQLSITNANGFGVEFTGTTTLSQGTFGDTTFLINNARPSTLVPGLTLSGQVTGNSRITVKGNGSLHLTNATNDFVGDIWVTQGFLSVTNDGALGDLNNKIILIDATVTSGFRAHGTFETDRVIKLGNSVSNRNLLQVTGGNVLTLNTAFEGNAGFVKGDNGTLALNQNNTGWDGTVMVLDGILEVRHNAALGTKEGATSVTNIGAAVHFAGDLNIDEDFSIFHHGINSTGSLHSRSGHTTLSGNISLLGETSIGVADGSTLVFNSSSKIAIDTTSMPLYTNSDLYKLTLTGAGSGFIESSVDLGNNILVKQDLGTWTFTNLFSNQREIQIMNGTLALAGDAGAFVNRSNKVVVSSGAKLVLDDSTAVLNNRLAGMAISLGGELLIQGQANKNHTETVSGIFQISGNGHSTVTLASSGSGQVNLDLIHGTQGLSRFAQGTTLIRGNQLGAGDVAGSTSLTSRVAPVLSGTQIQANTIYQGVLAWALADDSATGFGDSFATYDTVLGLRALNENEQTRDFAANANVKVSDVHHTLSAYEIATLQLESGGGIDNKAGEKLTVSSGGILAKEGNSGIQGGSLETVGTSDLIVHALGDLELDARITKADGGLTKTGNGTLTLSGRTDYRGNTSINQGTLKLNGGHHTLTSTTNLIINAGGVLDLNGYNQTVASVRTLGSAAGEVPTLGGMITNSGNLATFVTNFGAAGVFSGSFDGQLNVVRSNTYLMEVTQDWAHSGSTLINGGITRLANDGQISNSDVLNLSYGTLHLYNNGTTENNNRLADDMDIVMDGGVLGLYGRAGSLTSEWVGNVSLNSGLNVITASAGTNNANMMPQSSILTLSSLSHNEEAAATVNFGQSYNGTSGERLGLLYNASGTTMNIVVDGGMDLVNNLVGPWAVYTGFYAYSAMELVSYNTDAGFSALNTSGFAGYDATSMTAVTSENANVRQVGSVNLASGGMTINAAAIIGNASNLAPTLTFANASDLLTVKGGILAFSIDANNTGISHKVGSVLNEGRITAGVTGNSNTADLYIYNQNNNFNNLLTLNSAFVDNAALNKSLRLVLNGTNFGQYPFLVASNQNSYTGGTVLNNAAVRVSGNLGTGGLTLNGSNLTQLVGGALGNQVVTLNGASTLTLTGTNTLKGLQLNNTGGSIPTHNSAITTAYTSFYATRVNLGLGGLLRLEGNIHATSSNVASTSLIENGILDLNGSTRTFDVGAVEWLGDTLAPDQATLEISSMILGNSGADIIKTGSGLLKLSGDNSFSGNLVVQQGGIILGNNNGLGYGDLVLQQNTTLSADHQDRSIFSRIDIQGDIQLGLRSSAGSLSLFGDMQWGNAQKTVTVESQLGVIQDLMGTISGGGGITKKGHGKLSLSGYNVDALDWTGSQAIRVEEGHLTLAYGEVLGTVPSQVVRDNIVLNGGTLEATGSFEIHSNRGIVLGNSAGEGTGTLEVSNYESSLSYGGVIANHSTTHGSLVKSGQGELRLSGENTYTGDTFVTAGMLTLVEQGQINHSRHIHVAQNALLDVSQAITQLERGNQQSLVLAGSVRGNVNLHQAALLDVVSQRGSTSALTLEGDLQVSSASTLRFHLQGPSFTSLDNFGGFGYENDLYDQYVENLVLPSFENHRLIITGNFSVETGATVEVVLGENTPSFGEIYDLADWGSLTSSSQLMRGTSETSLFNFELPNLAALGLSWDTSHFASRGILVVIPEPSRALLILVSLGSFALRRRRR